jgi:hypothetical protein
MRRMDAGIPAIGRQPRGRRRPLAPAPRLARFVVVACLVVPAARGIPAAAAICHLDAVPAATLLLPYFEVNLDDPNGLTTLFSVNNASATAVLAKAVIWSDLAVPVLSFSVYLTGYDVQTINLRDILVHGSLPQTASLGQDPFDKISPKGVFSQDIDFSSCQGQLPPPPLPGAFVVHLQNALTGRASAVLANLCAGRALGDNVARGYVTVDTVNQCSFLLPQDAGYFAAGGKAGEATDQNVLWGAWYIVNAAQGYAEGSSMVAIEADGTNPATSTPGSYSFYGRYVGWSAADHREPLATSFAAQYALGGGFDAGTDLLVWRDPKVKQNPFPCPASPGDPQPPWYPLLAEKMVVFDEQEHPAVSTAFPCDPPCPPPLFTSFAAATQRTRVNGAALPVPFNFGWLFLDLNTSNAQFAGANPPADPQAAQAWVIVTESSHAHFAVALDAYRLDSACSPSHFVPH